MISPDRMEEFDPIEVRALGSLGLGFDLTSDFRLKFVKGNPGGRLVVLDEDNLRDVVIPGRGTVRGISKDVVCDKGDRIRFKSDVLEFNQMSELLNQKSSVQGKVPSGYFNAIFGFSGSWVDDAIDTKYLAFDGYFISLYDFYLKASPLVLHDKVKQAVPFNWEPAALSRFIQTYGTHIIVGMAIGGQDVICSRLKPTSVIPPNELKGHLEVTGDALFSDGSSLSPTYQKKVPYAFSHILQQQNISASVISESCNKDGLTVVRSKRGGNPFISTHHKWLQTVSMNPDAILFKFVPITSLLTGIRGSGYLSHAINLYLRYKPDPQDLREFLEFQIPRQWAPVYNELPLGPPRRKTSSSLQFSFMGPKLHVNTTQVSSDKKPVLGMRLYLEGKKCNRLAIHIEHLSSFPRMLESSFCDSTVSSLWRESYEIPQASKYVESVHWKRYSHVCTIPVEPDIQWIQARSDGVFIVTGAQLATKGKWGTKTTLHLRLLFTYLPNCSILKREWACVPTMGNKSSFISNLSTTFLQRDAPPPPKHTSVELNSGVFAVGPPVPVHYQKLLRFVDTSELMRGPHDAPGHWLVTAGKLVIYNGKIGLHVQFSLLNYSQCL